MHPAQTPHTYTYLGRIKTTDELHLRANDEHVINTAISHPNWLPFFFHHHYHVDTVNQSIIVPQITWYHHQQQNDIQGVSKLIADGNWEGQSGVNTLIYYIRGKNPFEV